MKDATSPFVDFEEDSQPGWLESDLEHVQLLWSKLEGFNWEDPLEEEEVNIFEVEPEEESDSLNTSDVFVTLSADPEEEAPDRTRQSP
eukprot:6211006-Amphidinium_carterae.1